MVLNLRSRLQQRSLKPPGLLIIVVENNLTPTKMDKMYTANYYILKYSKYKPEIIQNATSKEFSLHMVSCRLKADGVVSYKRGLQLLCHVIAKCALLLKLRSTFVLS